MIDAWAGSGYDTATADPQGGQIAEVRVLHRVAAPAEAPHKPVSGEMMMGMSNRGSMMGMGINIDMTKPRKALISTRLEARIKDRPAARCCGKGAPIRSPAKAIRAGPTRKSPPVSPKPCSMVSPAARANSLLRADACQRGQSDSK